MGLVVVAGAASDLQVAMAPGSRLRVVEISDGLGVAKSAVTKTVDRLEQRGLVVRERDPDDRRTVYGALTPEGHEVFSAARPVFVEAVERHFAGRVDRATLRQLLDLPALAAQPTTGSDRGLR